MSIRARDYVWEHSRQSGAALVLLLAIAERADDDGEAWPGVAYLAAKSRLSGRGVQKLLRKLEEDGELRTERGGGRRVTNRYFLPLNRKETRTAFTEQRSPFSENPEQNTVNNGAERVNKQVKTPNNGAERVNSGSPEPSVTVIKKRQEPSERARARAYLLTEDWRPDPDQEQTLVRDYGWELFERELRKLRRHFIHIKPTKRKEPGWRATVDNWFEKVQPESLLATGTVLPNGRVSPRSTPESRTNERLDHWLPRGGPQ
ncbi:MAG: helix-turn-helix domain-containing protein [Chloroflexota bacterium]|nr:helix-turn-helix domain-containing protein [Chloroflexota bacterium]